MNAGGSAVSIRAVGLIYDMHKAIEQELFPLDIALRNVASFYLSFLNGGGHVSHELGGEPPTSVVCGSRSVNFCR
jgi:hypothetical protein